MTGRKRSFLESGWRAIGQYRRVQHGLHCVCLVWRSVRWILRWRKIGTAGMRKMGTMGGGGEGGGGRSEVYTGGAIVDLRRNVVAQGQGRSWYWGRLSHRLFPLSYLIKCYNKVYLILGVAGRGGCGGSKLSTEVFQTVRMSVTD